MIHRSSMLGENKITRISLSNLNLFEFYFFAKRKITLCKVFTKGMLFFGGK